MSWQIEALRSFSRPIRQMHDEVLDLVTSGLTQGLSSAEIRCVGLDQVEIELMLTNDLAKAVTDLRVTLAGCGGSFSTLGKIAVGRRKIRFLRLSKYLSHKPCVKRG